jgi:hypothetical protein
MLFASPITLLLWVLAILHFIKRRPDTYWLFIIIIGGPIGALVYLLVEALPDLRLNHSFQWVQRRKRLRELETAVLDNPSVGNYEELGEIYSEQKNYARARECFDKAITPRTDMPSPFYGRAQSELQLGDYPAAVADLERVLAYDPKYDYSRAAGLLAHAYAQLGSQEKAARLFQQVIEGSTLSETQYNYAAFLKQQGKTQEAREMVRRILNKRATLPGYLKRRERPWFRRAEALLKQLPAS